MVASRAQILLPASISLLLHFLSILNTLSAIQSSIMTTLLNALVNEIHLLLKSLLTQISWGKKMNVEVSLLDIKRCRPTHLDPTSVGMLECAANKQTFHHRTRRQGSICHQFKSTLSVRIRAPCLVPKDIVNHFQFINRSFHLHRQVFQFKIVIVLWISYLYVVPQGIRAGYEPAGCRSHDSMDIYNQSFHTIFLFAP